MRDQELETIRQNTTELSQYSSELLQTYYLQTAILEPIINTLPDKLKVRLGDILITVIPIRSVNAAVIKLDSTFVIAVDTGLLHLLSYFHEIQVTSAMLGDKARGEQYLKAKCRFICEYYNRGGLVSFPDPDSQFKLTPAAAHMIVAQTLACEICLICHEIAHIMCGHLNQRKMTRLPMVGQQGGKQIPLAYTHKHTQEFQADFIGYRLYRSIFHKFDALNTHGD
jgi:hypothetical protein